MKRIIALLLTIIFAALLFSACSARNLPAASDMSADDAFYNSEKNAVSEHISQDRVTSASGGASGNAAPAMPSAEPEMGEAMHDSGKETAASAIAFQGGDGLAEKIIYSANANIETVDFDETIDKVYALSNENGAFIESSYIGGRNYTQAYYGHQTYRSAHFSIRVPANRLAEVTGNLDSLGNVTMRQEDAQNITAQFVDTESRLAMYRTEEERLLAMLGKADNIADMITIETRLSEVRYNVESLTSTLKNWQNQVDYSTLTLYIQEVEELTEITPIQRSYWQQIGDGLKSTLKGMGRFVKDTLKWLIIKLPVLAVLAAVVTVAAVVIKRRASRAKKQMPPDSGDKL